MEDSEIESDNEDEGSDDLLTVLNCAYENLEDIIEQERKYDEDEIFDHNYEENNKLNEKIYAIPKRSIKIIKVENENHGTILVQRIALPEDLIMANTFNNFVDGHVRVMILNVGDSDVNLRLQNLITTTYNVDDDEDEETK